MGEIDISRDKGILSELEGRGLDSDRGVWTYNDYLIETINSYGSAYVPEFLPEFGVLKDAIIARMGVTRDVGDFEELYWQAVKWLAPWQFEDFMLYMEKKRPFGKRFYAPRSGTLRIVARDLQRLEDGQYKFYGLSLPPRTGKSTSANFFIAWIIGKRPWSHNAMGGHSDSLCKHFYQEVYTLCTSADYTFTEIFPGVTLKAKDSKNMTLDFGGGDFPTFTCRGVDGSWTGAIDVSSDGYLYSDDLIRDRMESLSPQRTESKYQSYLNVMTDRKNDGARELMIGTRWNVLDPLGRVEEQYKDNPQYFFRKIPALDPVTGKSNFEYKVKGFSTEYYEDVKSRLDANEWMAKYQQQPFIREGLLFPEEELRFFNGVLPPSGFVRVVSACDVAFGGGDSLSMPIGYEYDNGDVYIVDWIFNAGAKEVTIPLVAGKIMEHGIQQLRFEANTGGDVYARYIDDALIQKKYPCAITHKRASTKVAKLAKIIASGGDVKRRFVFLAENRQIEAAAAEDQEGTHRFRRSREYDKAIAELEMFVQVGRNEHDDAADSLAQLVDTIGGSVDVEVQVMKRFF